MTLHDVYQGDSYEKNDIKRVFFTGGRERSRR